MLSADLLREGRPFSPGPVSAPPEAPKDPPGGRRLEMVPEPRTQTLRLWNKRQIQSF